MKRTKLLMGLSTGCALIVFSVLAAPSYADENYIYGTMDISYDTFYKAEGIDYEVDAVSSATDGKWKNENLTAGTYHQENEDGTGTILGVNYYVALTEETLIALGENNYNFTSVTTVPEAYKIVTVEDGKAVFSAVQGETEEINVSAAISTDTPWGDYQITVDALNNSEGTSDIGRIYGVILNTQNGDHYALRHLENIWRDSIAWSNGFVTQEPHGNQLSYEDFDGLMGQTITEISYITDSGYHNLAVSLYVPVKFDGTLEVADAEVTDGTTAVMLTGFPDDYKKGYYVEGMETQISESQIVFQDGVPGQYTLTVSDENGVYADVMTDFVLFTEECPVLYQNGTIIQAEGATEDAFANYIKNIATISVNGKEYAASGRRGVKIIGEDGLIDFEVEQNGERIFGENGTYQMAVTATGYHTVLEFELVVETVGQTAETAGETVGQTTETTVSESSSANHVDTNLPVNLDEGQKASPAGILIPIVVIVVCLGGVTVVMKKKK